MQRRDPFSDPETLIRRVYAYVCYRIGTGPDAEDVTSETFARALRHRASYEAERGEPLPWLIGIARRCIGDCLAQRRIESPTPDDALESRRDSASPGDLAEDAVRRLTLLDGLSTLSDRDRELIALRYGSDLTARQIAMLVGMRTNAIEVALHRALQRLQHVMIEPSTEDHRRSAPRRGARSARSGASPPA